MSIDRVTAAALDAASKAWRAKAGDWPPRQPLVAALAAALDVDRSKLPCPKCGSLDVHVLWRPRTVCVRPDGWHDRHTEHFRRSCRGCKHEWITTDMVTPDTPTEAQP